MSDTITALCGCRVPAVMPPYARQFTADAPCLRGPECPVYDAALTLIGRWHRWEGEAGQAAQTEQCEEAYDGVMVAHIAGVLGDLIHKTKGAK